MISRQRGSAVGLGWTPWAGAASSLLAALDHPDAGLPFGLSRD